MKNYSIKIGWLYPELMSTYGDRGNITVFTKRCEWRGIDVEISPINQSSTNYQLQTIDLLFGGGAQDREQNIVMQDLHKNKGSIIKELIEKDIPALFVCGAPQLMGNFYEPSVGERIEGLGIFDMATIHPGPQAKRLIGNVLAEISNAFRQNSKFEIRNSKLVGFENHGGRTKIGKKTLPFAKIIKGFGNNGEDGTEGVVYKNAVGTYLHGPLLPKNPDLADYFIHKALEVKYKVEVDLKELDNSLADKARSLIANRFGITL